MREAARDWGRVLERVREVAAQQVRPGLLVQGPNGSAVTYQSSEGLRLKERLGGPAPQAATDEWPDIIDEQHNSQVRMGSWKAVRDERQISRSDSNLRRLWLPLPVECRRASVLLSAGVHRSPSTSGPAGKPAKTAAVIPPSREALGDDQPATTRPRTAPHHQVRSV